MSKNKIYDHYYSSSDAIIYLKYPPTNKTLILDKAVGVGYTHNMSAIPVYGLGNVEPLWFSRGNSLVQGSLDLAFKSDNYITAALNFLMDQDGQQAQLERLREKAKKNGNSLTREEASQLVSLSASGPQSLGANSLSLVLSLFDIIIEFNNENATMAGTGTQTIKLEGVRFLGESLMSHSSDENSTVHRYTFLAKNKV